MKQTQARGPGLGLGIFHFSLAFQGFSASLSFCDDSVSAELDHDSTASRGGPEPTPEPVPLNPRLPNETGRLWVDTRMVIKLMSMDLSLSVYFLFVARDPDVSIHYGSRKVPFQIII